MSNNNNIEDIFRDAFQNSTEEPSQKVWNNLNKKLFVKNFTQKFADYTVKPSETVWTAINKQLMWQQFLKFSIVKFNIYYASFISITIILGLLYFINNSNDYNDDIKYLNSQNAVNNVVSEPINYIAYSDNESTTKFQTENININNENNRRNNSFTEVVKTSNNKNSFTKNEKKISNNNIVNNNNITQKYNTEKDNNKIPNIRTTKKVLTANNKNKKTEKEIIKNQENLIAEESIEESDNQNIINTQTNVTDNTEAIKNNNNISNINDKNSFDIKISKLENNNTEINKEILLKLNKLLVNNLYNPVDSFYNIYNPDTVGTDAFGNVITIDKSQIFVDVFASAQLNKYNFTSNYADNTYAKLISSSTKGIESYALGARLTYFYKNYLFQTGVGITNFSEKINYDYSTQQIKTTNFYSYFNTSQTVYDTIQIVNLDSLLATGDTVYSQYIKQNTVTVKDSSLQTKTDTNFVKQNLNNKNIYTYVEIPVVLGYRINRNKFSFNLSGGAIFGLFIKDKGYVISQNNINDIQQLNKTLPYIKPNISAIVKLGITYKLNNKISILAEPFYRRNINSWFDKSSIYNKQNSAYGIILGTRIFIK